MPDILNVSQKKEWELAEALKKFLPVVLEWKDVDGYPILYRKGFWGSLKVVAFFSGDKSITIERRNWKTAILEALQRYKDAGGTIVEVRLGFEKPKNLNRKGE
jgi:hypothetical protein